MPLAYSYIRFSTKKQAQGDSLRRQTEKARAYARQHGLRLDESLSYQDLGVSAFDGSNVEKGQLAAFMQAVRSGKVAPGSFLLVEQFDRLSRLPPLDALMQLQALISAGITVVTLDDERIWDTETVKDPSALFLSLATLYRAYNESESKSGRLTSTWQAKRDKKQAVLTAECPRWLKARSDRTGFDVIPEKAESVRRVFELTIGGYGNVAIARRANHEKWPHPGKVTAWNQTLITKLVANRAVLGEFQPRAYKDRKRVPVGEPWPDYYPRIISDELFTLANAAKSQRARVPGRRDKHYKNLFQGILVCGTCGGSYVRKNKQSTKQPHYSLYMCARRTNGLTKCSSVNGRQLELNLLLSVYTHGYEHLRTDEEAQALQGRIKYLQADHENVKQQANRLIDLIVGGSELSRERLDAFEKRLSEISTELKKTKKLFYELALARKNSRSILGTQFVDDYNRVLDESEVDFRAELRERILSVINRVVVYPDRHAAVVYYKHLAEPRLQALDSEAFDVHAESQILYDAQSVFDKLELK